MAVGEGRARASGNKAHDLQCLLKYSEFVVKHAGIYIDVKHAGIQKPYSEFVVKHSEST